MESITKIFKIGYGPSSSHTMGPANAATMFKDRTIDATSYDVTLYGSLAWTGRGHLTDQIIERTFYPKKVKVNFDYHKLYDYHPNAILFKAFNHDEIIDEWLVFSVGGGEIKQLGESRYEGKEEIYYEKNMDEILKKMQNNNWNFCEYVDFYEKDINEYLFSVLRTMEHTINKGLNENGLLPGKLHVERKASLFYQKYLENHNLHTLICAYALATSEENANGEIVVTAPTCGASGVLPAVLIGYKHYYNINETTLINALKVAGLIGNIVKHNASISGAEVGCQGEIGVACSMTSAALAYIKGATNFQIEYAAEIALEHHLGMTCDPIDGMVQIPCIERNALSAEYSLNVADYATTTGGLHHVTLDSVIEVMNETGRDLHAKYRETSSGGLALRGKNGK